jgi:hypothetical protein
VNYDLIKKIIIRFSLSMKMVKPRTNGGQSKMELQRNNLDRLINGLVLPQFPTMQLCHAP